MSVNQVKAATGAAQEVRKSFPQMLSAYKNHIAMALPKHLNADRMARVALTAFRQNPKLEECTPESVFASIIIGSQLGLEPGILGQAYLVPYKGECQLIPGWQGYVDLVSRAGRASVWTGAVYGGDEFDYELGDRPFLKHKPCGENDPAKFQFAYSIGRVKNSEWPVIEVWQRRKIEQHRDRFNKVGGRHYSFANFEMYGRKVPLLQVLKYMPKSIEMQQAYELDNAADSGSQSIDLKSAIDGTWTMPAAPPASEGFDVDQARQSIGAAMSPPDLESRWKVIAEQARVAGVQIPIEIEAARNDRKSTLEQL